MTRARYTVTRPGPEEGTLFERVVAVVQAERTWGDYKTSASLRRSNRIGSDGEPVWPLKLRAGR